MTRLRALKIWYSAIACIALVMQAGFASACPGARAQPTLMLDSDLGWVKICQSAITNGDSSLVTHSGGDMPDDNVCAQLCAATAHLSVALTPAILFDIGHTFSIVGLVISARWMPRADHFFGNASSQGPPARFLS